MTPPSIASAVASSVAALDLGPADAALVALAVRYAECLDGYGLEAAEVAALGGRLLTTLTALRATPAARSTPAKGPGGPVAPAAAGLGVLALLRSEAV